VGGGRAFKRCGIVGSLYALEGHGRTPSCLFLLPSHEVGTLAMTHTSTTMCCLSPDPEAVGPVSPGPESP
jgi:hypothetical protein